MSSGRSSVGPMNGLWKKRRASQTIHLTMGPSSAEHHARDRHARLVRSKRANVEPLGETYMLFPRLYALMVAVACTSSLAMIVMSGAQQTSSLVTGPSA